MTGAGGTQTPAAPVPLRRNRGFRLLWIGQILSDTGSEVTFLAYPLLILALTHSPVIAGVVGTGTSIAGLCLRLPAGALADRLDRRLTLIVCDSLRAGVLALLGVLVLLHQVNWPIVLIVALIDKGANTIFDPAANAALPAIVADEQLEEAWVAIEGRGYAAGLVGPALGGVLFSLARAVPFLTDAASYAVSVGTVSRIRGRFRPDHAVERKRLWHEVTEGLRFVWAQPILRAILMQAPLVNFAFNGVIFGITLGLRKHGTSAEVIGLVQAGIAAGGLVGAFVASWLQRLRLSVMVIVVCFSGAVLFGVSALLMPSPFVALPVALAVLLSPAANAGLFAVMLRFTPEEMRGRVSNTVMMLATGLAALAPLIAGLLIEHVSVRWAIGAFALVMVAASILAAVLPGVRKAEALSREASEDAATQ
ncbi:MAG TPA: MFS transporter [Streptosporangiaceae bacterium]|nr:MFS transporter [Streptosporangiaceae bacterium]